MAILVAAFMRARILGHYKKSLHANTMIKKLDENDVISILGLVLLGVGLYLVDLALALSVVGGILLVVGVLGAMRRGQS